MTNKLFKYKVIIGNDCGYSCCGGPTHFAKTRMASRKISHKMLTETHYASR